MAATEDYTMFLWGLCPQQQIEGLKAPDSMRALPPNIWGEMTSGTLAESPSSFQRDRQAWAPWRFRTGWRRTGSARFTDPPQITSRGVRVDMWLRKIRDGHLKGAADPGSLLHFIDRVSSQYTLPSFDSESLHSQFQAGIVGLYYGVFVDSGKSD